MLLYGYLSGRFKFICILGMLLCGYLIGWFRFICILGMLLSGYLIGRFKFRARVLVGWNIFVTAVAIIVLVSVFQVYVGG
jgi:hypothetical protein